MPAITRFLGNLRIWPGPVLAVELVTTARRTRYFVLRVLYAVALFIALCFTYLVTLGSRSGDMNASAQFTAAFFGTFGVMQLAAVLLIGPALAAGAIAQERQRRTIEYLYTTPLSNLEIVIGKLGGRVLQILFFVLSGVPVLALAMLLGGIAPWAVAVLTAITLSTVLFVTMVSIAVSAWTAKARDAVVGAYLVFFCLWVLPFLLSFLLSAWSEPLMKQVFITNPVMTFTMILTGEGPWGRLTESWPLLLALVRNQMLAGGTALGLATLFMRRIHLREAGKLARKRRRRTWFFRDEIGDNPMYWKELCVESGASRLGLLGYGLLTVIFIVVCGSTVYFVSESLGRPSMQSGEFYCDYAIFTSTLLCCCGLLLLIARAAASITAEKERDCWASLISTPLEPAEIIKAKILGNIFSLRGLVPLLAVVWLPAVLLQPSYFCSIAFTLLDLGILAAFAATLGIYCSQSSKSTLHAMGAALGIAVLIGGVPSCCCPWIGTIFSPAFLLAGPGMASLMLGSPAPLSLAPFFIMAIAAYLIGTAVYALAAYLLMRGAIRQFDKKNERTQRYRPLRLAQKRGT